MGQSGNKTSSSNKFQAFQFYEGKKDIERQRDEIYKRHKMERIMKTNGTLIKTGKQKDRDGMNVQGNG